MADWLDEGQAVYDEIEAKRSNSFQRSLAEGLRQQQEEHPIADFLSGFIPGIGSAMGMADHAAGRELDEPIWMQLLQAAGAFPGVRPAAKIIGPNSQKLADYLADLPEGGIRGWLERMASDPDIAADDANYKFLKDMFTPDGDFRTYHGGKSYVDKFDTSELERRLADQMGVQRYGKGLYGSTDLETPISYGKHTRSPEGLTTLYELDVPREDIGRYLDSGDIDLNFADQTEEVKDALRRLYPTVPDEEATKLFRQTQMFESIPMDDERALQAFADRGLDYIDNPGLSSNLAARDAGLLGNIHPFGNKYTRSTVHFDPDRLNLSGTYAANYDDLGRAFYRSMRDANPRSLDSKIPDSRAVLDQLFGPDSGAVAPLRGVPEFLSTPDMVDPVNEMLEKIRYEKELKSLIGDLGL